MMHLCCIIITFGGKSHFLDQPVADESNHQYVGIMKCIFCDYVLIMLWVGDGYPVDMYFLRATKIGAYLQSPETEILTPDTISKQCFYTD